MTEPLRPSSRWAAFALAVAMWFGGLATIGSAQDRSNQDRPTQDRTLWARPAPEAGRTDEAARIYAEARTDLEQGQVSAAQRKLEVLVARFPASPLADVARRDLQRIYAGSMGARPQPGSAQPAARVLLTPQPEPAEPTLSPVATPAPRGAPPFEAAQLRDASEEFRHLSGDRIFFADGSIDLGGRAKSALEAQAAWLNRYPGIEVVVEGHSDDQGSREYNRAIAEQRAYAVKLRLNDLGVSADRIRVAAFGRERRVADCQEVYCSAQNRRAVTVLVRVPPELAFDITRGPDRKSGIPPR